VARRWQVLEEGRRYLFYLRDDCRWSDGAPVTASDFVCAWKRQLDPGNNPGIPGLLFDVRGARAYRFGQSADPDSIGVHALDNYTLAVELEEPAAYFLYLLAAPNTYAIPRHVVEAHGDDWSQPAHLVTSGPFRLDAWRPGESLVLVRNPTYHGQARGNVQRVEIDLRPVSPADLEARYAADELDVVSLLTFPPEELDRVRQRAAESYLAAPVLRTFFVGFDVSRPPFADIRVRQALVHAVDRETLIGTVMRGQAFPATGGFVPAGMVGHSAGSGLPYDVAFAQRLLAEAGYPEGRGFPALEGISATAFPWAEPLAAAWREHLGIEVRWHVLPVSEFEARVTAAVPPTIYISGWIADYPDPDNFLRVCTARRIGRWQDDTYDELVATACRTADQVARMQLYAQADRIQIEQAAMMPMTYGRQHHLVKPWVSQYPTSAICAAFWKDVVIESRT
jgi:ABC-type oligopeptide transport system substrate-binding subunit